MRSRAWPSCAWTCFPDGGGLAAPIPKPQTPNPQKQGGAWNYGESAINQFGGSTTSFADHSVMGSFGVTDTAYSGEASYAAGIASMNSVINVDPGTAASTAGHGIPGATAGI
ncbi:hypothetical protein T484DRAFT_1911837 [Baffinella frigidus]|nr:hypothetical protein T484DRAFT_1911837 [Cryptophyta sp. CCMP2293]